MNLRKALIAQLPQLLPFYKDNKKLYKELKFRLHCIENEAYQDLALPIKLNFEYDYPEFALTADTLIGEYLTTI